MSFVLTISGFIHFANAKQLLMISYDFTISSFAERIDKDIVKLTNNAKDLALMGSVLYKTRNVSDTNFMSNQIPKFVITNIFKNYSDSLGGGIWFEPYIINPSQRLNCLYAFRNKQKKIVIDKDFNSEEYNYLNQSWYKEIIAGIKEGYDTEWSAPYFEKQGSNTLMTTVGAGIYDGKKLIGISTVDWEINSIINSILKMEPTKNSFVLFADKDNDFILAYTENPEKNTSLLGKSLDEIPWYSDNLENKSEITYNNEKFITFIKDLNNGMLLIVNIPKNELFGPVLKHFTVIFFIFLIISILVSLSMYKLLKRNVNDPIEKLVNISDEIGQGNLDAKINIEKPQEFARLSSAFNKMTNDIKDYINRVNNITHEKEKMESELSIARSIQYSVLPNTFYPNMKEFDIFASMETAKEVGGDFYDFFFINDNEFMFLIADVSGKGIPAALFMMTTKTLIKNLANESYSPKELIEKINNQICENNRQGFFVTMFAGIININTGKISYINCGHNPPLIKKNNRYNYLNISPNLVLGAMNDIEYDIEEDFLNVGDVIFLYTDGVTEAFNPEQKQYGEERLLDCLNKNSDTDVQKILRSVKSDVKEYSEGIEQSDDITMLCFKYNGCPTDGNADRFSSPATIEGYREFRTWLKNECEKFAVNEKLTMKIELVCEELFTNVISYAYGEKEGEIGAIFENVRNELIITFIDNGVEYNPLDKPDPDISLALDDRPIGGLGIFMVKQSVDDINYKYEDGKNILQVKWKIN